MAFKMLGSLALLMFVTASVQSSTATTLMTVSFVNAGLLTLAQAISVIMGAHIGTTVTAWIMSLGFSFNIANFVYPAFFVGIILIYLKSRRVIGDFLFGVGILFLGLTTLNIEREINDYRKLLKEKNVADIEDQKYGYQMGVHYMDVVNDCEKLGDYVMNVEEAHINRRLDL